MKKFLSGLYRPIIRCFHNFSIIILFAVSAYCSAQSVDNYLEKVYLDIDKSHYLVNETIWFKAYLVDGRTNTKAQSEVLYVDLIDPASNIVTTKIIKISEAGGGAGEFQLSPKFVSGDYTIRAYTNYMRNFNNAYFFRKKIYIKGLNKEGNNTVVISENDTSSNGNISSITTKKPDVQFLPESGVLVNEISNRVAFKVVDANGKSISLNGVIKDHKGNKVSSFSTSKFGMGIFMFKPKKGANYKAYINYNGKDSEYPIPEAVDKGVTMIVRNNTDQIHIVLQSTLLKGLNGLTLVGKQFGEVVTRKRLSDDEEWIIKLKTEKLKEGIVKFTILDEMKRPLSERLVFIEKKVPFARVSIDSLKNDYHKRDLISFNLKVSDFTDNPLQSNMSISVSEVENSTEPHQLNIKSHLLLESELKGTIESPSYYFKSKNSNRLRYLDLLMLTQGWRKYVWAEMDSMHKYAHNIESGFNFKGSVSNFYNHKKKKATKLEISFINDDKISNFESKTKENGLFHMGEYDILDSTSVFISAKDLKLKYNKKMRNSFHITLDSIEPPVVSNRKLVKLLEANTYKNKSESINEQLKYKKILKDYPTYAEFEEDSEELDEVKLRSPKVDLEEIEIKAINAKLEEIRKEKRGFFYSPINTTTLVIDDLLIVPSGTSILPLLYRIPGIMAKRDPPTGAECVGFSGPGCAPIIFNGRKVDPSQINSINPLDVDFIDVYGRTIVIYARDGRSEMLKDQKNGIKNFIRKGIISIEHPGYSKAKEFYSPIYNTADSENDKPDYRSTLYWNPNLALNEDGKINVSFYTADLKSTYKIQVEGITSDGVPIVEESFITVE